MISFSIASFFSTCLTLWHVYELYTFSLFYSVCNFSIYKELCWHEVFSFFILQAMLKCHTNFSKWAYIITWLILTKYKRWDGHFRNTYMLVCQWHLDWHFWPSDLDRPNAFDSRKKQSSITKLKIKKSPVYKYCTHSIRI